MANIVPGALWQPIDYSGHAMRRKGRGAVAHVAVSESANLRPSGGNSWHFYLPRTGPAIQYVDLDRCAYAQLDGNPTMVSWESQGGVINADNEAWSDNQVEWGARILAHLNKTEAVPLRVMSDSLSTSKGLGYHRLGVDPWRVSGGEKWSSAYGKLCPGAAKIAQIPRVVALAKQIVNGTQEDELPLTPQDDALIKEYGSLTEAIANRTRVIMRDVGGDERTSAIAASIKRLATALAASDANDAGEVLAAAIIDALPSGTTSGITKADVEEAVRAVLGSLDSSG